LEEESRIDYTGVAPVGAGALTCGASGETNSNSFLPRCRVYPIEPKPHLLFALGLICRGHDAYPTRAVRWSRCSAHPTGLATNLRELAVNDKTLQAILRVRTSRPHRSARSKPNHRRSPMGWISWKLLMRPEPLCS